MTCSVFIANAASATISCYRSLGKQWQHYADIEAKARLMPMACHPVLPRLYAVSRAEPYQLLTYRIDPCGLVLLQRFSLPHSMVNLEVSSDGDALYCVSFADDSGVVLGLNRDGLVTRLSASFACGRHPHAIHIMPNGRFAIVSEMGSDRVCVYRREQNGALQAHFALVLNTGCGPRHFCLSPCQRYLYVLTELSGEILTLKVTPAGQLCLVCRCEILPPEDRMTGARPFWAADLQMSANGRWLFASERNTSQISVLKVARNGRQVQRRHTIKVETQPRGIALTPDNRTLIVSGEQSPHVGFYHIAATGELTRYAKLPCGQGANWVSVWSHG